MIIVNVAWIILHPAWRFLRWPDRTGHILSFQFHCMHRLVGHSFNLAEQGRRCTLPNPMFLSLGLDNPLLFKISFRFPLALSRSLRNHALDGSDVGVVVCTQLLPVP